MKEPFAAIAEQLRSCGFSEDEPGCFTSKTSPRVIGLVVCPADPETWRKKAEDLLRKETMRVAVSWTRYVIVIVDHPKTSALAWSAAAFAQDVSKCRRIILFFDPADDIEPRLPFLGLPPVNYKSEAPARDVETIVRNELPTELADAFLNEDLPTARVQSLVEESD